MSWRGSWTILTSLILIHSPAGRSEPPTAQPTRPAEQHSTVRHDFNGNPLPAGAFARIGTARLQHSAPVYWLAFSADSKAIIVGDHQGTRRWDPSTGRLLQSFYPPDNHVSVALSHDGRLLATFSEEKEGISLWDSAMGKRCAVLKAKNLFASGSANIAYTFSPDGKSFVTGSADGVLRLWDTRTGRELRKTRSGDEGFLQLRFSPDGRKIAAVVLGREHGVVIWDAVTLAKPQTLPVSGGWRERRANLAFTADGRSLLTSTPASELKLWDLATGKERWSLRDSKSAGPPLFLALSADGRFAAVDEIESGRTNLWDLGSGKVVHQLNGGRLWATCAAFSPDGRTLATGDIGGRVRLWETATGKERTLPPRRIAPLTSASLSPDGRTLAVGDGDGNVRLWSFPGGVLQRTFKAHPGGADAVAFAPGGGLLATSGADGLVRLWDPASGKQVRAIRAHEKSLVALALAPVESWVMPRLLRGLQERCALTTLTFAPDGKTLATGGPDPLARLWEVKTGKLLRTFKGRKGWVSALAFTPDGKTLAGGGYYRSGSTCLWDVKTGKLLREFKKDGAEAKTLTFSPDGKQMVAVGEVSIDFVTPATGKRLARLSGNSDLLPDVINEAYTTAAFSSDGRTVAVGSSRGFSLYDATTRKKIGSFDTDGLVDCTGIIFTPDGRALITAYTDGTALFWDLAKLRGKR